MRHIRGIDPGRSVSFQFEGRTIQGFEGESIASALMRAGLLEHRLSPRRLEPRGYYCGMGQCWDCAVTVDGAGVVRGCSFPLSTGLQVRTADGALE